MTTERKFRWAANFFIWLAVIVLAVDGLSIFDRWSRTHALRGSPIETLANFVGFLAGALLYNDWLYIFVLVNGLVLRRYKSRVAAAVFIGLGLYGVGLAAMVLWRVGFNTTAVEMFLFFALNLLIAAWTFVALTRLYGSWPPPLITQIGFYVVRLLRRPAKFNAEARADVYYPLIAKAVSELPVNEPKARRAVYDRARRVLAERSPPTEFERESFALETAIRRIEKSAPRIAIGNPLHRPTTISLVISLCFPRLWLIDVTCMSLYWVGRLPKV